MYQVTFVGFKEHGRDAGFRVNPAEVLLSVAKNYHIPVPFECEDGHCGSCVVKVEEDGAKKSAHHLTERESDTLVKINALTEVEVEDAEEKDLAPKYRLACQCKVWTDIKVYPYDKK